MNSLLAIAVGGAGGAVLRYGCSQGVHVLLGRGFPYGTLAVNVFGSLLMGFLFVLLSEREFVAAEWRALLLIGVLGSFTTFSTFSIETLNLVEQGELIKAGVNIIFSVALCLIGCWMGILLGRQL